MRVYRAAMIAMSDCMAPACRLLTHARPLVPLSQTAYKELLGQGLAKMRLGQPLNPEEGEVVAHYAELKRRQSAALASVSSLGALAAANVRAFPTMAVFCSV